MAKFEIKCSREAFSIEEIRILEMHGRELTRLACGKRKPTTEAQRQFVEAANKKRIPESIYEKTWAKYVSCMKWEKRHGSRVQLAKDEPRRVYDDREDWRRMRGTVWGDMMRRARGFDE